MSIFKIYSSATEIEGKFLFAVLEEVHFMEKLLMIDYCGRSMVKYMQKVLGIQTKEKTLKKYFHRPQKIFEWIAPLSSRGPNCFHSKLAIVADGKKKIKKKIPKKG